MNFEHIEHRIEHFRIVFCNICNNEGVGFLHAIKCIKNEKHKSAITGQEYEAE